MLYIKFFRNRKFKGLLTRFFVVFTDFSFFNFLSLFNKLVNNYFIFKSFNLNFKVCFFVIGNEHLCIGKKDEFSIYEQSGLFMRIKRIALVAWLNPVPVPVPFP